MTLTSPYWLFAASAILVPIAIHLWNKRQGKTVKVGSLRWLQASASRRWSSIRLSDVWLLVLRCLILILLAVALAKPVWEAEPAYRQARKAVFISPELLHNTALRNIKPTVDALLQRGYTLYHYSPIFTPIPEEQWQALSSNPTDSVVSNGNYWALLPALAQRYPQPQDSVWLFTSDQQRHFAGEPAPLQENIRWVPVALESTTNWVQAAYALSSDSLLLITGRSNRDGTTYQQTRMAASDQTMTLYTKQAQLKVYDDSLVTQWGDHILQTISINKEPLRIGIAHDKAQQSEVRYLSAAVQAISDYTGIPVQMQVLSTAETPDTSSDWLFWLSQEKVPGNWLEQVENQGTNLWIQSATKPSATIAYLASAGSKIRLHQLSTATQENSSITTAWYTSAGESLLTVQPLGNGSVYHFQSGFSPAWSQLGKSAQLPELLLPLLLPQQTATAYDARALDEKQLKPTIQPLKQQETQEKQQYNLIPWVVLLAFVLFLAERLITSKRATF